MRSNIITILLIFFYFGTNAIAQGFDPEQKAEEANAFYEAGKYKEAESIYTEIINEGYESAALYFNTANCFYRMNNIGLAVYYYEKAKLLDPFDEDILYNAELAELRVKNQPSVLPDFAVVVFLKRIVRILSADLWAVISLLLFIGLLAYVFLYFRSVNSKQKKVRFMFAGIFLFFSGLTFFFSQYQLKMINSDDTGIILTDHVEAKSSPDENANTLFTVYEGYKIEAENELNGWTEISLTDGRKAWIKNEHIKFL